MNRYFICSRLRPAVEISVSEDRPVPDAEIAYFIRGFRLLERSHVFDGYTVCFAWSSRVVVPFRGDDVIVVVYGDEHCRIPAYAGLVGAVLKCHGFFPNFVPRRRPLRLAQIELTEFLRNLALWAPAGWRWLFSRRIRARCHLLPVGYGIPFDREPLAFQQRRYLISFLGSVGKVPSGNKLRRLVGTPKAFSRSRMLMVLESMLAIYGSDRIKLSENASFQESISSEQGYADTMFDTLICVAPRGTAHESLRLCEGLQAGCVVIADKLPPHPFYQDSPIIQIEDWRDLPALVSELVADPEAFQNLQRRGVEYWRSTLSEEALAQRYADALCLKPKVGQAGGHDHPPPVVWAF